MQFIILYGPGEVSKRAAYLKVKQPFAAENISVVDFKQVGIAGIDQALVANSLFSTGLRLVVVEQINDSFDCGQIHRQIPDLTLLLLASNPRADSVLLKTAKKIKVTLSNFEGEKETSAFPFLDSLIEGRKTAFLELEKLMLEYGAMYVLSMIFYMLRRNILPLPASPFMNKKISMQKRYFSDTDWQSLYYLTLQTENLIKTGSLTEKIALTKLVEEIMVMRTAKGMH